MQHRKTLLGLLLAAALVAAAAFLLPAGSDDAPAPMPEPRPAAAAQADTDKTAQQTDSAPGQDTGQPEEAQVALPEDGIYTARDDVALYLVTYGHLPGNFITKEDARALGWSGGGLEAYAPGKCIGGDEFGNYEGILPDVPGRTYHECDIDTLGAGSRGAKRLVYSDDGNIYYTDDHYESFTLLYGDDEGGAP